jgi:DNA mismatch repair protein MutL
VCERFATSKLARFEDLTRIRTYGFRGEALASISHVARVSVTSMTAGARAAYRAAFADGRMLGPPAPCAGVKGTSITVEEMFHNVPARRAAFKATGADEYARILEVMQRYALHTAHRGVGFTCKKLSAGGSGAGDGGGGGVASGGTTDLHIAARTSVLDAVGVLFGTAIKRELLPVAVEAGPKPPAAAAPAADSSGGGSSSAAAGSAAGSNDNGNDDEAEEPLTFSAAGYVTNANYGGKKGVFVLFINDRLVDCGPLRRAVEGVYADVLPRGQHPWVYLALSLPPSHVDVNVHPTKREVAFLHTDALVAAVAAAVGKALGAANASRTFYTQTLLPLAPVTAAGASTAGGAAAAGETGFGGGDAEGDVASLVRAASGRVTGGAAASGGRFGAGAAAFSAAYAATPGGGGGGGAGGDGHTSHAADGSCCGGHGHGGGGDMQLDDNDDGEEGDGIDTLLRGAGDGGAVTSTTRDGVQVLSASSGAGGSGGSGAAASLRPESDPSVKLRQPAAAGGGGGTGGWTISYLAPPPAPGSGAGTGGRGGASASSSAGAGGAPKPAPNKTVRVDLSHRGLDVYLQPMSSSSSGGGGGGSGTNASAAGRGGDDDDEEGGGGASGGGSSAAPAVVLTDADVSLSHRRAGRSVLQPVRLISVREVLSAIDSDRHAGLARLLPKLVFVGLVGGGSGTGAEQCLAQADTRLLLLNYVQLAREVAYQQAWRLFANLRPFELAPPLDVAEMAALALGRWARATGGGKAAAGPLPPAAAVYAGVGAHPLQPAVEALLARHDGDAAAAGGEVAALLASKAPMLDEYFSVRFTEAVSVAAAGGKRKRAAAGAGGGKARRGVHPMHAAAAAAASSSLTAGGGVIVVDDDSDDSDEDGDAAADADTEPEEEGDGGSSSGSGSSTVVVQLTHLPRLLDGHTPQLAHTPDFLVALALTTDWTAEKPCFHGVAQSLAHFYAIPPPAPAPAVAAAAVAAGDGSEAPSSSSSSSSSSAAAPPAPPRTPAPAPSAAAAAAAGPGSLAWTVEHVLLPSFRRELSKAPPRKLGAGHYVVQVACTEQLYRIFERC